ncbi:MAG: anti-sigma factor antagonist [Clostridia bacterium]|nr:anti-sigma factor antagonist [Clostridia bacterium]
MNDEKNTPLLSFCSDEDKLYAYVSGEIDHHSAKVIREGIDEQIFALRPKKLYINLKNVDFMDSSGLGLIMGRYKLMKIYGGKTFIESPSHRVLKIIELAQMGRIIDVVEGNKEQERNLK